MAIRREPTSAEWMQALREDLVRCGFPEEFALRVVENAFYELLRQTGDVSAEGDKRSLAA